MSMQPARGVNSRSASPDSQRQGPRATKRRGPLVPVPRKPMPSMSPGRDKRSLKLPPANSRRRLQWGQSGTSGRPWHGSGAGGANQPAFTSLRHHEGRVKHASTARWAYRLIRRIERPRPSPPSVAGQSAVRTALMVNARPGAVQGGCQAGRLLLGQAAGDDEQDSEGQDEEDRAEGAGK